MGTHTVYRLTFKTQLHLGRASGPAQEGSLGLEKPRPTYPQIPSFQRSVRCGQRFTTLRASQLFSRGTRKTAQFYLSC